MITRSIVRTLLGTMIVAIALSTGAALAADSIKGLVDLGWCADCKVDRNLVGRQRRTHPDNSTKRESGDDGRFEVRVRGCARRRRALPRGCRWRGGGRQSGSRRPRRSSFSLCLEAKCRDAWS